MEKDNIKPMAKHYGIGIDDLHAELHQILSLVIRKQNCGIQLVTKMDPYTMLQQYREAFPDVFKLVKISLTLPVTSAGCERSLSCMKQQKTNLRNTSGNERTSNLGVLKIGTARTIRIWILMK